MEFIEKNIDKEWSYLWLFRNPNLTWDFVVKHKHEYWDWENVIYHPNMIMKFLERGHKLDLSQVITTRLSTKQKIYICEHFKN